MTGPELDAISLRVQAMKPPVACSRSVDQFPLPLSIGLPSESEGEVLRVSAGTRQEFTSHVLMPNRGNT